MPNKKRYRLLVTGGSSYLGRHLVPLAGESLEIIYTYFQNDPLGSPGSKSLDIRDEAAVSELIQSFRPEVIIHTVGSNRSENMVETIQLGTKHVVAGAQAVGARLIHLSTDSIFSGEGAPYDETAPPTPINAYGRAKAVAEATVLTLPDAVIVRTSLIYGLTEMDHGTRWLAQALQRGERVTLFDNQIRNPVWVMSLSRACLELAGNNYAGILNVAGSQPLTRAEFGLKMLTYWDIKARQTLTIGPALPGRWPLNCEMDVSRAKAVLATPLPGVDAVLDQSHITKFAGNQQYFAGK